MNIHHHHYKMIIITIIIIIMIITITMIIIKLITPLPTAAPNRLVPPQRRHRAHGHLLPHRHGVEPHGQGREGDRHRRHPRAHPGPAASHGQEQGPVRVRAHGRRRGGPRHPEGPAAVASDSSKKLTTPGEILKDFFLSFL